jgi:hypothetical protein
MVWRAEGLGWGRDDRQACARSHGQGTELELSTATGGLHGRGLRPKGRWANSMAAMEEEVGGHG